MKRSSSLWTIIDKKSDQVLEEKKSKHINSLWIAVDEKGDKVNDPNAPDLFQTLKHRANAANEKPKALTDVLVKKISENAYLKKSENVETKINPLNVEYFVLRNSETNKYYQLTDRGKYLWDLMDGDHTIRDLALEYFNKYGAFAYDDIIELVDNLEKNTFLNDQYLDIYKNYKSWSNSKKFFFKLKNGLDRYLYSNFPIKDVDKLFTFLHQTVGKHLFSRVILFIFGCVVVTGTIAFAYINLNNVPNSVPAYEYPLIVKILLLFGLNFISLFVHELGHALTTKHFGRFIPRAGFLLYFGVPSVYVDTSDMWLEKSKRRIIVSSAGMVSNAIFASLLSIILLFLPTSLFSHLIERLIWLSYMAAILNLYPLVEWDGYFILMDLLKIPCLRKKSISFIKHKLLSKLFKRQKFSRLEAIYTIFGGLSIIGSIFVFFYSISFWKYVFS